MHVVHQSAVNFFGAGIKTVKPAHSSRLGHIGLVAIVLLNHASGSIWDDRALRMYGKVDPKVHVDAHVEGISGPG